MFRFNKSILNLINVEVNGLSCKASVFCEIAHAQRFAFIDLRHRAVGFSVHAVLKSTLKRKVSSVV